MSTSTRITSSVRIALTDVNGDVTVQPAATMSLWLARLIPGPPYTLTEEDKDAIASAVLSVLQGELAHSRTIFLVHEALPDLRLSQVGFFYKFT